MPEFAFWQGNTALAHGALLADCNFFGGYPITPSTEITEVMAKELTVTARVSSCSSVLRTP